MHIKTTEFLSVFHKERDRIRVAFDRKNRAVHGFSRELERHRARACADVPDGIPRLHAEPRDRNPPHFFLGHRDLGAGQHFVANRLI